MEHTLTQDIFPKSKASIKKVLKKILLSTVFICLAGAFFYTIVTIAPNLSNEVIKSAVPMLEPMLEPMKNEMIENINQQNKLWQDARNPNHRSCASLSP
ncbi:MAG: hypothetical protein NXI01_08875 [Gammaproteobacteria bacterium]|nr:hypothetical protein [Gammaproteobacteria bacterium]